MPIKLFRLFDDTTPKVDTFPDFSHPLEKERLKALKLNTAFDSMLKIFVNQYFNLTFIAQIPDRYFPVTEKTFPTLHKIYTSAYKKLEIEDKNAPTLFCTMDYTRNAKTIGTDDNCMIIIDSSCFEVFSDRQIFALLGRELGHIKKKHVTYLNAFNMIDELIQGSSIGGKIFDTTVINGAKGLLIEWLLTAEYTADRAAAIVAGGIQPVMQNHLMSSGIENAKDCKDYRLYTKVSFQQNLNALNRTAQVILIGTIKTFPIPFVIQRMQELEKWSVSDECKKTFPEVYANSTTVKSQTNISASLIKGQKVDLTKNNSAINEILVGLGWDTENDSDGVPFDLDASAFLLGKNGKVINEEDFIFYGNLKHKSNAVQHMGDNLTGVGKGDDEQIKVHLSKVPAVFEKIDFTVTIYEADKRNQTFGQVKNAFIRITDAVNNEELIRYDLGENFSVETAVVVGEIYRHNGEWKFNAIGAGFKGGLAALCKNYGIEVS